MSAFYFDEAEADRAVRFFSEYLTLTVGEKAGQPFRLMPWAERLVRELIGWKRTKDNTRRYRRAGVFVPRKNAKTTVGAGLGAFFTFADREPGAHVYSAAGDREQASVMFEEAKRMIEASPDLSSRAEVFRRAIVVKSGKAAGSAYKVLSADAKLKHGLNPHAVLFDELHVQPDRRLWEAFSTAQGARRQPVLLWVSTAGYDVDSLGFEQYEYACKVRDGVVDDPEFLPIIYEAGRDDDWTSPETWKKANPGLGHSVSLDFMEARCREARENPHAESEFRRFYLNQWIEARDSWIRLDVWDAAHSGAAPTLEELERRFTGRPCWVGLDLSSKIDVTAIVYAFPDDAGGIEVFPRFFIPEESLSERVRRDRVPYDAWLRAGYIRTTDGNAVDYGAIETQILEDAKRFEIQSIAFDPWNASATAQRLTAAGLEMVEHRQGYASMSGPTKDLEVAIRKGKVRHYGNPVLRWMAGNACLVSDPAGNVKLTKPKPNSVSRIDGVVALVMAAGRASVAVPKSSRSVYEERGILTL